MNNKRSLFVIFIVILFSLSTLVGCSGQDQFSLPQTSNAKADEKTIDQESVKPEKDAQENEKQAEDQSNLNSEEQNEQKQVEEESILIESPQPDSSIKIGMSFQLEGKAKTNASELQYEFEDGHNILSKGKIMLTGTKDAGGWIQFKQTVKLEQNPSSPFGTLILYTLKSDGTKANQMMVTYNFDPEIVKP